MDKNFNIILLIGVTIAASIFIIAVIKIAVIQELKNTDGAAYKLGFTCYREDFDVSYEEMIKEHERCHHIVNKDKKHFCKE
jgi:hypothetical protein